MMETAMELLERFTRGEIEAFETLFQRHQADVYRWVVCLIRDPAAAEDVTLETFWRIYRAHARFDPARIFGAWARRIGRFPQRDAGHRVGHPSLHHRQHHRQPLKVCVRSETLARRWHSLA